MPPSNGSAGPYNGATAGEEPDRTLSRVELMVRPRLTSSPLHDRVPRQSQSRLPAVGEDSELE
jgi:hypothetical protein